MQRKAFLISGAAAAGVGTSLALAQTPERVFAQNNSACIDTEGNIYSSMLQNGFYDPYAPEYAFGHLIGGPDVEPTGGMVQIHGINGIIYARYVIGGILRPMYNGKWSSLNFSLNDRPTFTHGYIENHYYWRNSYKYHRKPFLAHYWVWDGYNWEPYDNLPDGYMETILKDVTPSTPYINGPIEFANCNADWRSIEKGSR